MQDLPQIALKHGPDKSKLQYLKPPLEATSKGGFAYLSMKMTPAKNLKRHVQGKEMAVSIKPNQTP
jgi:hypothetical protein